MDRARVLVADDKENMLKLLSKILGDGCEVTTAPDGQRALALLASQEFDVVVSDIKMPGADGFAVLEAAKRRSPDTEVVLMTAFATVQDAVEAMKQGAYDYLQKPFDPDAAAIVIGRAAERKRLREQAARLRREVEGVYSFDNIIGKSAPMREVFALLERAAALDISVLLTGDTGTGKELAARAIHHRSARRDARFVPVNCGALPPDLVESELFGHARGAFTGAAGAKRGLFEEAAGGTLFLDEIGELPLPVQVKLNRALQEKEIRRVGDNAPVQVDVRVIAATHRDLKAEAAAGRFREDLFYRLHVFPIRLPALRERRDDIPPLVGHFLEKYAKRFKREITGLHPEALRALTGHPWPGNVRELEHVVERAVAVASGSLVELRDLPPEVVASQEGPLPMEALVNVSLREAVEVARERASRDYLVAVLKVCGGHVTQAAQRADVARETLHRLLKRYGLRADDFRSSE